jgi:4-amino-4-deoxy-L-arabinose transferase-like glycosyltransferase
MASPRAGLLVAMLLAVIIRLAAQIALPAPLESDFKAYFIMAETLASGHTMRDTFGQIAFYSPGYPLLLAPLFALFGSSVSVALWLNLALSALTAWLIYRVAGRLSGSPLAALLVTIGYALWLPSVLSATMLAKENLSLPLMAAFVLALLSFKDSSNRLKTAAFCGLLYGASLLTGASSLLIVFAFALALYECHGRSAFKAPLREAAAFALGTIVILSPWLAHTAAHLGKPVLTTNSGFNFYLGNNPAATGSFISIKKTPAAPRWEAMRANLGEIGAAAALGDEAKAYMIANPGHTIALAAKKLALFWAPNVPDAVDFSADAKRAGARWIDVVQHVLILIAGIWGALFYAKGSAQVRIVIATVLSFWVVHAATYNIVRYREPVMPLMLALASLPVASVLKRRETHRVQA